MLQRVLAPRADLAHACLRIVAGLMFSFHGLQKVFGVLAKSQPAFGTQVWFGGVIELFAGLAIAAGAGTRCAALLASGTMAVAYVQFHWKLDLGTGLLPAMNKGELALLYSFVFLHVACRGAGAASVDGWMGKRKV